MGDLKKPNGRPALKEGKRNKFINVRFTEEEFKEITELEEQLSVSKTELIRMRILSDSRKTVVNAKELIGQLDTIGAEMGRIGNNINQLARHANMLQLKDRLDPKVIDTFNQLFDGYIQVQQALETAFRKIIRAMGE